ncbi:porin family protein [Chryseobacterium sp. PMSZPI]|uniref:porin family protein n=1 Tax=Chryseobacterium sp. PMSZPI TaxID=1033900 RepID=UPI000C328BDD|nr:porin family protein [Chryseobacterium sp. PMSZPI]PKF74368.1 hypothetical protein CW752_10615 [Chryseobacterium sp. PMSZPI]
MKKTILLSLLLSVGLMNAQHKSKYGLFAGVNFSSLSGSDSKGFSSRTGFHAGGFIWSYLSDKASIDVELAYSQMGADFKTIFPSIEATPITLSGKLKTDYLRLPVLFTYHPVENFSVSLGPEVGMLLSKEVEYNQVVNGKTKYKPDNMQSLDAGIKAKIHYVYSKHYLASVGYYLGMTKIYKDALMYTPNSAVVQDAPKIYNSNFNISFGYVF